jgi:hypothetical protein
MQQYANAADVIKSDGNPSLFIDYIWQLDIIHRAPESDWPGWSRRCSKANEGDNRGAVETVKGFEIRRRYNLA